LARRGSGGKARPRAPVAVTVTGRAFSLRSAERDTKDRALDHDGASEAVEGRDRRVSRQAAGSPGDSTVLLETYRLGLLTRLVDERMWILARQGAAGFVLTPRGHEVAQVASALALRRGVDFAWPYYRDLGVALALGVTPEEVFLGALGRGADPHTGGRQLSMHFASPSLRIGSVSSAVGAHLPHAVGAAYAAKVRGEPSVSVCWFGEGAASEGTTHESLNLAAIHRLPVVFLCENNGWAISVPEHLQSARPIAARVAAYGAFGCRIDGNDPLTVFHETALALERARRGDGPSVVETVVHRMTPHSSQDDDAYRSRADKDAALAADPIPPLRARLISDGLADAGALDDAARSMEVEVAHAAEAAKMSPPPDPARARRFLYSRPV
jgi:2-oxoisovalerate dehydrogenase E1 component alpha subunit